MSESVSFFRTLVFLLLLSLNVTSTATDIFSKSFPFAVFRDLIFFATFFSQYGEPISILAVEEPQLEPRRD